VLQHERKKCPAGLDDAGRYSKIILIRLLNFFFIQDYAVILFYFYLHFACVIHDIMALHVFVIILLSPNFFCKPYFFAIFYSRVDNIMYMLQFLKKTIIKVCKYLILPFYFPSFCKDSVKKGKEKKKPKNGRHILLKLPGQQKEQKSYMYLLTFSQCAFFHPSSPIKWPAKFFIIFNDQILLVGYFVFLILFHLYQL
jgi:hypothetical protein